MGSWVLLPGRELSVASRRSQREHSHLLSHQLSLLPPTQLMVLQHLHGLQGWESFVREAWGGRDWDVWGVPPLLGKGQGCAVLCCAGGCDEVTPDEVVLELQQDHPWGSGSAAGQGSCAGQLYGYKAWVHGSLLLGLCLSHPAAIPCLSNTCPSGFSPPPSVVAQRNCDLSLTWKIHTQLSLTPIYPWQHGFKLSLTFAALILILGIILKTLTCVLKAKKQQLSDGSESIPLG